MNLKVLLGDAYNEALTHEEIDNLLASKKLVDISKGEYVNREKAEREKNEAINAVKTEYDKKISDYENNVSGLNEKIAKLESDRNDSVFLDKIKSRNIDEKYIDYIKAKYTIDEKLDENLDNFIKENPAFLKTKSEKDVVFQTFEKKKGETKSEDLGLAGALREHYK